MPELPEVEVVRRGLIEHVIGRRFDAVEVLNPRAARRQVGGPAALAGELTGRTVDGVHRRGKFLWLSFAGEHEIGDDVLVVHLGMSGQMLVQPAGTPDDRHLRIRVQLNDGKELRFVDQRTFGGWFLSSLTDSHGQRVPQAAAHIALDPLDPEFDAQAVAKALRHKHTQVKRALLDQTLVSGIGNIYADEALWRARLHGARRTEKLTAAHARSVLGAAAEVMRESLAQGGTSFDALYVDVAGQAGYFSRSLQAYGREGEACVRCGAPMIRESFMNRSSFSCPVCQRPPVAQSAK